MKKEIEELLQQALTPTEEPDFWINQKILNQAKETDQMDGKKVSRRIPAAALAAAIALGAGSVTAYAAWKYLTPQEVTENVSDLKLMEAFSGKDAVLVKEQQSCGGYDVTFLGIVSGSELSQYKQFSGGQELQDRSYIVTAIEKSDGTPFPDTSEDAYADLSFFVSPLIRGYDPNQYNAVTMHGSYQEFTEDGILYRITECDNVEIFADKGLYLCVMDETFYNSKAYDYNDETGEITRNEAYQKLNALFDLPIDPSKADPKAAAEYKNSMEDGSGGEASHETAAGLDEMDADEADRAAESSKAAGEAADRPESSKAAGEAADRPESSKAAKDAADQNMQYAAASEEAEKWMEKITPENIDQYAERVESTVQVLTPDQDGNVSYKYEVDGRGGGSGSMNVPWYFKGQEPGMSPCFSVGHSQEGLKSMRIETYTLNEDGTMTFAVYIPKES